jgi:diguanylate cyclase (GGDEF)-like protein
MSVLAMATAAHLVGSLVLAVFFALLGRHDPRRYLHFWTAAWCAQALALLVQLFGGRWGGPAALDAYLFLLTGHGVLVAVAAWSYSRGTPGRRALGLGAIPLLAWAAGAPLVFGEPTGLHSAELTLLAATFLVAAAVLWPLREPGALGLRIVTAALGLVGVLHLARASAYARPAPESLRFLEMAPFAVLFVQMAVGLGVALAVMEAAQWAASATSEQLKEAQRRLQVLAETDALTGCSNRGVFRALVDDLRASGPAHQGVVILFDLDGLGAINAAQGQAAGDEAIRGMAAILRAHCRSSDLAVRWGGDELALVIPGAGLEGGEVRRAEIGRALTRAGFFASSGLAAYSEENDILAAVEDAEQALERAKRQRRDAAEVEEGADEPA